jgi:predicted pyridoxine 5'-phosphate oxidase superfamily flavin-nucleotide-binding protein
MPFPYTESQRALQDRFQSRSLADRIDERLVKTELGDPERGFIEHADMFFLATADREGQPTCSYKGGDRGFVHVLDSHTLAFPVWDGNGMFLSLGNLSENPKVGLLFVDFAGGGRLRVEGEAALDDGPLREQWPEAELAVRVGVKLAYPNCGRYVHRYQEQGPSRFVPREGCETPEPSWKQADWARGAVGPRQKR